MTSTGILYIDEECRDTFTDILDKTFGNDIWKLDGSELSHIWDRSDIPPVVFADILNRQTDEIIGYAKILTKYSQEYNDEGDFMYLEPSPDKIEITKVKK